MTPHRLFLVAASILATAAFAESPVEARRIIIDQAEFISPGTIGTACTIGGAACTGTTLPFTFDFGGGPTDQVFIYDSGIVSFGAPIPNSVDPLVDPLTSFGVPVIAPLYDPDGPYEAGSRIFDPSEFNETLPNFGTDMFLISFIEPALANDFPFAYVHLILDASATELRFEFIHGESFTSGGVTELGLPNVIGTQLGYSVLGQQLLDTTPDIDAVHAYSVGTPSAVPEPATWLMMILGFGAVGYVLRWCRDARATLRRA